METLRRAAQIQYGWSRFLWKHLEEITDLRAVGQYAQALERLMHLCDCIPYDVYQAMEQKLKEAEQVFYAPITAPEEPFQSNVVVNRVKQQRAKPLLRELLMELVRLLDQKGYLERRFRPISTEDFAELEE